jgi:hypothetical protein
MTLSYQGQGDQHQWKATKNIHYFTLPVQCGYQLVDTKPSSRQASLRSSSVETEIPPIANSPEYGEEGFRLLLQSLGVTVKYNIKDSPVCL